MPPQNHFTPTPPHNTSDPGSFLLNLARHAIACGDDVTKALDYASRASLSFSRSPGSELELAMSLQVVGAIYCSMGRYSEAISVLERSVEVMDSNDNNSSMGKFSGYMQLGDTYGMMGQFDRSISCYNSALTIQLHSLGHLHPSIAHTSRYLAEAYIQAMHFDEAEKLCTKSLEIRREHGGPEASLEEAADRRLMALICEAKGDFESALEHLVLASMLMIAKGQEIEVAAIDLSIGNVYLSLCRFEEAVCSYQKALTVFKSSKGGNHTAVATVFIRLADLYCKTGQLKEAKSFCENALRIYSKPTSGTPAVEIVYGLTEISAIYEALNEPEEALGLLHKATKLLNTPGQHSKLAGIEARMGVMFYVVGRHGEARSSFGSAVAKLRACGETTSAFFGILLNQMGLASVQLYKIDEAAELFEEARRILEKEFGPYDLETLGVYSNLAATYDALGRVEDAIEILEYILKVREEKLGTANPDVDDEKKRLTELLKEAGRSRIRKGKSLKNLLGSNRERVNKRDGVNKLSGFSFRT